VEEKEELIFLPPGRGKHQQEKGHEFPRSRRRKTLGREQRKGRGVISSNTALSTFGKKKLEGGEMVPLPLPASSRRGLKKRKGIRADDTFHPLFFSKGKEKVWKDKKRGQRRGPPLPSFFPFCEKRRRGGKRKKEGFGFVIHSFSPRFGRKGRVRRKKERGRRVT